MAGALKRASVVEMPPVRMIPEAMSRITSSGVGK
jgi:hypothetical protein